MTEPVVLGIGSTKFVKEATTKMITLFKPTTASGYEAMVSSDTGTNYIVPVGKKLIILQIHMDQKNNASSQNEIYKHTIAGVAGGTQIFMNFCFRTIYGATGIVLSTVIPPIQVYIEVAASNYINTSNWSTQGYASLTCVECDV